MRQREGEPGERVCLNVPWARNARDRWHRETRATQRLVGSNLPDTTNYEAECERGQDRETHYHFGHRYLLEARLLLCRARGYRTVLSGEAAGDCDV